MGSNRMTLAGILIALLVVGALIGIYALPKKVIENEEKKAAEKLIPQAAQHAAHQVAEDEIRKAAADISDRMLADQKKKEAAPTVELKSSGPVAVDRDAFTMTLPEGSEVDPPKPQLGKERYIHADLPARASVSIVVIPDKRDAGKYCESTFEDLKSKTPQSTETTPEALQPYKLAQLSAVKGKFAGGHEYMFEVGEWDGTDKACIIIAQFPARPNDAAIAALQRAFRTFKMQQ